VLEPAQNCQIFSDLIFLTESIIEIKLHNFKSSLKVMSIMLMLLYILFERKNKRIKAHPKTRSSITRIML
jgi:hypothetical protein